MEAVRVKHLQKRYKDVLAVEDVSFDIQEGELFALLGENGAGKSTTINILCTLLEKSGGEVEVFGKTLGKEDAAIRNEIGMVFQHSVLDDILTVKENLMSRGAYYGLSKAEVRQRLEPFWKAFALDEIWKRRYGKLSGGQKRRVDIVRALLHQPRLLILDEPTTGLDPKSRKVVWDYIHFLRKERGLTILLTTHYMEECDQADHVVVIDHGKVLAEGTVADLKNAWTNTVLRWYTPKSIEAERVLQAYEHCYRTDYYEISMATDITDFLYEHRQLIQDYEVVKGSMDDVFLKLTGRKMRA